MLIQHFNLQVNHDKAEIEPKATKGKPFYQAKRETLTEKKEIGIMVNWV